MNAHARPWIPCAVVLLILTIPGCETAQERRANQVNDEILHSLHEDNAGSQARLDAAKAASDKQFRRDLQEMHARKNQIDEDIKAFSAKYMELKQKFRNARTEEEVVPLHIEIVKELESMARTNMYGPSVDEVIKGRLADQEREFQLKKLQWELDAKHTPK